MPVRHWGTLRPSHASWLFVVPPAAPANCPPFQFLSPPSNAGMCASYVTSQRLYDDWSMLQQLLWMSIIVDSRSLIISKTTVNIHWSFQWLPKVSLDSFVRWVYLANGCTFNRQKEISLICCKMRICYKFGSECKSYLHCNWWLKAKRPFMEAFWGYLDCRSLFYLFVPFKCTRNAQRCRNHQNPNPNPVSVSGIAPQQAWVRPLHRLLQWWA